MMRNNKYSTLVQATENLIQRGYSTNFRVDKNEILTDGKGAEFNPSEVILEEFHRFEGMSNPADSSIIYAVRTKSGIKGTVVDSYGADGSEITSNFMNKVEQSQKY